MNSNDLIVVTGAGGFIGGSLVRYFKDKGFHNIRAVDKKPFDEWYQLIDGVENLSLDLSDEENCRRACHRAVEVHNLAADIIWRRDLSRVVLGKSRRWAFSAV